MKSDASASVVRLRRALHLTTGLVVVLLVGIIALLVVAIRAGGAPWDPQTGTTRPWETESFKIGCQP